MEQLVIRGTAGKPQRYCYLEVICVLLITRMISSLEDVAFAAAPDNPHQTDESPCHDEGYDGDDDVLEEGEICRPEERIEQKEDKPANSDKDRDCNRDRRSSGSHKSVLFPRDL